MKTVNLTNVVKSFILFYYFFQLTVMLIMDFDVKNLKNVSHGTHFVMANLNVKMAVTSPSRANVS